MSAPAVSNSDQLKRYIGLGGQDCTICWNPYTPKSFRDQKIHKTACEHFFHSACLARWMNERKTCPVCIQHIDFDAESACWNAFLQKEHKEILQTFPECGDKPPEVDDETLALELQEEEARKKKKRKRQIYDDCLLAMRLAQEGDASPTPVQNHPQVDPLPVP